MDFSPVNPNCCFCGQKYLGSESETTGVSTENEKIEFLQSNQYCKSCNEKLVDQNYVKKCFNCFSSKHETSRCRDELKIFHPRIDTDLFSRFASMLEGLEKYYFAFSSKEALKSANLKHLIVAENMKLSKQKFYIPTFDYSNILVTEKFEIFGLDHTSNIMQILNTNLFTLLSTRTLMINAKSVLPHNLHISMDNFFLLLSPKTTTLNLCDVQIIPEAKLSNILKSMPNVERFVIRNSNIDYDNLWSENLNFCQNLRTFYLPYKSLNLPYDRIRGTIKTWSKNESRIVLDFKQIDETLFQNFSNFTVDTCGYRLFALRNV